VAVDAVEAAVEEQAASRISAEAVITTTVALGPVRP
jgi:hypothetical protein